MEVTIELSLQQAAALLGKSVRQVRYLVQQGRLPAHKSGRVWRIRSEDLPLSDGQRAAATDRRRALGAAVERALGPEPTSHGRGFSFRQLRAAAVGIPLVRAARQELGDDHPAARQLHLALGQLAIGAHRYHAAAKRSAYEAARDAAALAACELALDASGASATTARPSPRCDAPSGTGSTPTADWR